MNIICRATMWTDEHTNTQTYNLHECINYNHTLTHTLLLPAHTHTVFRAHTDVCLEVTLISKAASSSGGFYSSSVSEADEPQ